MRLFAPVSGLAICAMLATPGIAVSQTHLLVHDPPTLRGPAGTLLPDPVTVTIWRPLLDLAGCRDLAVRLAATGGGGMPNPTFVPARWSGGRCEAEFRWTLGPLPGPQEIRATLESMRGRAVGAELRIAATAASASPSSTATLGSFTGSYEGIAGTVVDRPVEIEIAGAGTGCARYKVAFTASGDAEVKPPTAPGIPRGSGCFARTSWKLPTAAWLSSGNPPRLVATLTGSGVSGQVHATTASVVEPADPHFANMAAWAYTSRDFEVPLQFRVDLDPSAHCAALEATFVAEAEGTASPGTAFGERSASRPDECIFETRWKLGAIPGGQTLRASLSSAPTVRASYEVTAHRPPRFVAGLVVVPDGLEPPEKDTLGNIVIEEQRFWPVVGVDLALVSLLPRKWVRSAPWTHYVRPILAGSVEHPGENIFLGLSLTPILAGVQSEDAPVQAVAGYRWQDGGDDRGWIGATVDVSAGIAGFLKGIGGP